MLHLKACYRMVLLVYVVAIQAKFDLWLLVFRALWTAAVSAGEFFVPGVVLPLFRLRPEGLV